jgi:hypothetical protein
MLPVNTMTEINLDDNLRILARQAVIEEITFRMNKLWRIFQWASTVLVAITGGVITLQTGKAFLVNSHRYIIAVSSIVIGVYALIWLQQNLRLESLAREALAAHDKALGIHAYNSTIGGMLPRPDIGIVIGYKITVLLPDYSRGRCIYDSVNNVRSFRVMSIGF